MEALLEELSLNAWPAVRQVHFDNWVLRFSGGHTRRANSVNILGPSSLPLEFKVTFCEEAYHRLGLPTVFKFAGVPGTEDIELYLAGQGYGVEGNATVMVADLEHVLPPSVGAFRAERTLSTQWLDLAIELAAIQSSRTDAFARILESIAPEHCFASVWQGDEPVGIGLGVAERGWVGLFDIVTAEPMRRRGFGRSLVLGLMLWGQGLGAECAYLQVVKENAPAIRLYETLGFSAVYEYWYRAKRHHRK